MGVDIDIDMNTSASFTIIFEYIEGPLMTNGSLSVTSYISKHMRGELAKNYELLYLDVLGDVMERSLKDDPIPIKCQGKIMIDNIPSWFVGNRVYEAIHNKHPKWLPFHRKRIYNFDNPKVVLDIKDKIRRDVRKLEYHEGEKIKTYPFDVSIITCEIDSILHANLIMKKDFRWVPAGLIEYKSQLCIKDKSQFEIEEDKRIINEDAEIRFNLKQMTINENIQRKIKEEESYNIKKKMRIKIPKLDGYDNKEPKEPKEYKIDMKIFHKLMNWDRFSWEDLEKSKFDFILPHLLVRYDKKFILDHVIEHGGFNYLITKRDNDNYKMYLVDCEAFYARILPKKSHIVKELTKYKIIDKTIIYTPISLSQKDKNDDNEPKQYVCKFNHSVDLEWIEKIKHMSYEEIVLYIVDALMNKYSSMS